MMNLQELVAKAFAPGGALTQCMDDFLPRAGQSLMAQAVAQSLQTAGVLVVEAGTGVGKTYAYLVPSLLSGERVMVSTATKTLQDQLFSRDIPRLAAALGLPVRTALLKGRSSYLCLHRMANALQDVDAHDASTQQDLARTQAWSVITRAGDVAEMTQLDERSPALALITSTRENCLGGRCPQLQACHVNQARREAMAAEVVVVNHHLFFADLSIRESGVAELLPTVHSVVFDEAHQLNEIGVQFMGRQLTTHQLDSFVRDLASQGKLLILTQVHWPDMVAQLARAITSMRSVCRLGNLTGRVFWTGAQPSGLEPHDWHRVVSDLHLALQQAEVVLRSLEELTLEIKQLRERASGLMAELDVFSHSVPTDCVRWLECGHQVKLFQSPLDIATAMRAKVFGPEPQADRGNGKSWVFTSATLGHDANMTHFVQTCGLQGAQLLQVQSPFDYPAQAALYIPTQIPKPSAPGHSEAVAMLVWQAATALGGRTLVLTTSLRAMREIAAVLRQQFSALSGIEILVQGEAPKRELTVRFVQGAARHGHGCILVGSASFWEGFDVPGDALQMVVIDKLPFSPPGDPVVEARAQQVEANGNNAFHHFHVPQAAVALKQGAGRLIRKETDRGILVVCDVRLAQVGYGRRILAALPAMKMLTSAPQFMQALKALTRPSTTDR